MRRKIVIIIVVIICIFIFGTCFLKGGQMKLKSDNDQDLQELITYKFPSDEFSEIQEMVRDNEGLGLFEVIPKAYIECVRSAGNARYVVLLSEINEKMFIFFDSENIITGIHYIENSFLEYHEFTKFQVGISTLDNVIKFDNNAYLSPVSAIMSTTHIVKEGVVVVTYSNMKDGVLVDDYYVTSIELYENDKIESMSKSNILISVAPYILPIDKQ